MPSWTTPGVYTWTVPVGERFTANTVRSPSSIDTLGADTSTSSGVAMSTSGTWVQVTAATSRAYRGVTVCPTSLDNTMSGSTVAFDIGVGPGGSEVAAVADCWYVASTMDTTDAAAIADVDSLVASHTHTPADMSTWVGLPVTFTVACSDEITAITTGNAKVTFRMPHAMTLTAVRASLTTASSSGTPTFDINEGGSSILSTKLTVDASELTSTTAATAAVISDANLADDAEITIDFDVAGTGAKGVKITFIGTRA